MVLRIADREVLDPDRMLEHVGQIVAAVEVPVPADLKAGYGNTPAAGAGPSGTLVLNACTDTYFAGTSRDLFLGPLNVVAGLAKLGFLDGASAYGDIQRRLGS